MGSLAYFFEMGGQHLLQLNNNEILLTKREATYYLSMGYQVFGDLHVTNQRTIFAPKLLRNKQGNYIEFLNDEIKNVETFNSFRYVPDGLKITLHSNQEYKFKLFDREHILEKYRINNVATIQK